MLVLQMPGERCEGSLSLVSDDHKAWAAALGRLHSIIFWRVLACAILIECLPALSASAGEGGASQRTRQWVQVSSAYVTVLQEQLCVPVHGLLEAGQQCTVQTFLLGHNCEMLPLIAAAPPDLAASITAGSCKIFALSPQQQKNKGQAAQAPGRRRSSAAFAIHQLLPPQRASAPLVDEAVLSDDSQNDGGGPGVQPWTLEQGCAIVDSLRRWAPKIVADLSAEDAAAEKVQLEGSIVWVERLQRGMQPHQQTGRRQLYSDVEMLRWWSLSGTTSNFSALKDTVYRSLPHFT